MKSPIPAAEFAEQVLFCTRTRSATNRIDRNWTVLSR